MKIFELNNKQTIPAVGFGVFMIPNDGPTYDATLAALKAGYRHIDTAAGYMNESDVGKAIKDSGIDRKEVFITSKLWLQDYGYENAKKGIETSLKLLGVDYIDLYLLHQPYGDYLGAWKALEEAYQEGKIKSIGISNITVNLWNKFKKTNTSIKGSENGWAAAVEYYIKKDAGETITQAQVSQKYEVSSRTLGKRYKALKVS